MNNLFLLAFFISIILSTAFIVEKIDTKKPETNNADSLWSVKNLETERKIYELQRRNQAVENFIDSLARGYFDYYPCIWDVKQKYTTYVNFHANYTPDSILYPKFKYYGLIK